MCRNYSDTVCFFSTKLQFQLQSFVSKIFMKNWFLNFYHHLCGKTVQEFLLKDDFSLVYNTRLPADMPYWKAIVALEKKRKSTCHPLAKCRKGMLEIFHSGCSNKMMSIVAGYIIMMFSERLSSVQIFEKLRQFYPSQEELG